MMDKRFPFSSRSTDDLRRLSSAPLAPEDRRAVERELAQRQAPRLVADSKDQLGLFDQDAMPREQQRQRQYGDGAQ